MRSPCKLGFVLCLLLLGGGGVFSPLAYAYQTTVTNPAGNPNGAISASAYLDFQINIGKFIFFRVGTAAYPVASPVIDAITFDVVPSIPLANPAPTNGNSRAVTWNGTAPVFSVSSTTNVLPVEVRSNAGQVSIRATVSAPLSSGSNTIPMSQVSVASSNTNLPAPPVPNSGTGAGVNVVGSTFGGLVTNRNANWTFSYANTVSAVAGTYVGEITFTASAP